MTRQGIWIMEEEFTYGMANVMVSNISYAHALSIAQDMKEIDGVDSVMFEKVMITMRMHQPCLL